VELRGGDGSANPYLAVAGALAAGLDGVKRGITLGATGTGPSESLPLTLLHAVDALEADPVLTSMLDVRLAEWGDDAPRSVASYFAELKRDEFFAWHSHVSSWEHDSYLTAF
jgi:glutamine synthetase